MADRPDLVSARVPPLVRQLAIPAATGYFFNTLYNVIDSVYAGAWSTAALAALGGSFPVFFVVIATMTGLGQGAAGMIARALGSGDEPLAARLAREAMVLALLVGVSVGILGLIVAGPLLRTLGLDGEAAALAHDYLVPVLLGAPLFLLNAALNARLAAQGDTRSFRNALVVGAVANVGLNPVFMFGLGLGVTGIALATVLIQAATCAYLLHRSRADALASVTLQAGGRWGQLVPLSRQSLPATGNMALIGVSLFTITAFVGRHGEAAVAAYSVGLRVEQLFLLPTVGLSAAALTLVGNAYGAKRYARVSTIIRTAVGYGLLVMGLGTVVILVLREPLMSLFSRDPAVIDVGTQYLAIAALIQCAYVFTMMGNATLQGLGQPIWGFAIAVFRSLVAPLAVLWTLDVMFRLGLGAMFWGIFAINWLAAAAMILIVRNRLAATCSLGLRAVVRA